MTRSFTCRASIGIALFPEHGRTTADLLRRADLAMYDAKRSGNSHAVFDAAQEKQMAHQLALLATCVSASPATNWSFTTSPRSTWRPARPPASRRWSAGATPSRVCCYPPASCPRLERTALIAPLTRWVLNEALRQQRIWRGEGVDLTMAVNISARTLTARHPRPPRHRGRADRDLGHRARPADLELTESALIEAAAPDVLARLHNMGAQVSIDDFGTGYSSLAYLQNLPIDQIKVDQSFVMNLASVPGDAVIVRSTIDLAHNLGLTVVAEGVEDEVTLDMLVQARMRQRPRPLLQPRACGRRTHHMANRVAVRSACPSPPLVRPPGRCSVGLVRSRSHARALARMVVEGITRESLYAGVRPGELAADDSPARGTRRSGLANSSAEPSQPAPSSADGIATRSIDSPVSNVSRTYGLESGAAVWPGSRASRAAARCQSMNVVACAVSIPREYASSDVSR